MNIQNITVDSIIKSWKFQGKTPANGDCFYSPEFDLCATIYMSHTKIFYDRIGNTNLPHSFNNKIRIKH